MMPSGTPTRTDIAAIHSACHTIVRPACAGRKPSARRIASSRPRRRTVSINGVPDRRQPQHADEREHDHRHTADVVQRGQHARSAAGLRVDALRLEFGRERSRIDPIGQPHEHAPVLVDVGDQLTRTELVERLEREHHAGIGVVSADQRKDRPPDHGGIALAARAGETDGITDLDIEFAHRLTAQCHFAGTNGHPAGEYAQLGECADTAESHRADLRLRHRRSW